MGACYTLSLADALTSWFGPPSCGVAYRAAFIGKAQAMYHHQKLRSGKPDVRSSANRSAVADRVGSRRSANCGFCISRGSLLLGRG
jgi:hypothetical protein